MLYNNWLVHKGFTIYGININVFVYNWVHLSKSYVYRNLPYSRSFKFNFLNLQTAEFLSKLEKTKRFFEELLNLLNILSM